MYALILTFALYSGNAQTSMTSIPYFANETLCRQAGDAWLARAKAAGGTWAIAVCVRQS